MNEATKPVLALGFVLLALLGLMLANPSFDKSEAVFAENSPTVSDSGLRFTLQR